MKRITSFIGIALVSLGSYSLVAQEDQTEKVELNIQITKDGKTETIVKEFEVPAGGEDMLWNFSDEDEGNVIIRKHLIGENEDFWKSMPSDMEMEKVAFLGVKSYTINGDIDGPHSVRVMSVIEGEAAQKAGLKNEDIIESIDGQKIATHEELVDVIRSKKPGDEISIAVNRNGESIQLKATLGEREVHDMSHFKHFEHLGNMDEMKNMKICMVQSSSVKLTDDDKKMVEKATGVSPSATNSFEEIDMQLFPNPAEDNITYKLNLNEGGKLEMLLMDPNGKVVEKKKLTSDSGEYAGEINLQDKPSGNYLLIFKRGDNILTEKVMKR